MTLSESSHGVHKYVPASLYTLGISNTCCHNHNSSSASRSCSALLTCLSTTSIRVSKSAITLELSRTPCSYQARIALSLRLRSSAISAAWAICVASMAFILSANAMRLALSDGSGTGPSLMAVNEDSVAGNVGAEARTIDWIASMESCDGGSDAEGVWKKSGFFLSEEKSKHGPT